MESNLISVDYYWSINLVLSPVRATAAAARAARIVCCVGLHSICIDQCPCLPCVGVVGFITCNIAINLPFCFSMFRWNHVRLSNHSLHNTNVGVRTRIAFMAAVVRTNENIYDIENTPRRAARYLTDQTGTEHCTYETADCNKTLKDYLVLLTLLAESAIVCRCNCRPDRLLVGQQQQQLTSVAYIVCEIRWTNHAGEQFR